MLLIRLLWFGLAIASYVYAEPDERLIGWLGDTYTNGQTNSSLIPKVEVISWKPRAFIYHNLITHDEARHLQRLAAPRMQRSTVVGAKGQSVEDSYRTSYGTFINRYHDNIVRAVEERVAAWTHLPVVHQEDIQVLRYANGQKYGAHMDVLEDGSPRIATLLIYLSQPEEGGETSFPQSSEWADPKMAERFGPFSSCANGHVAFKPKMGDGLLFWSLTPSGERDHRSTHEGCPVTKGVKWTTTFWLHSQPFRPEEYNPKLQRFRLEGAFEDPAVCKDLNPRCKDWAAAEECTKNAGFMIGKGGQGSAIGRCRLSCGACEDCAEDDNDCRMRNRNKAGFLVYNPKEFDP